jgi:hypothetical protein
VLGVVGGSYLRVVDLLSLEPREQLNDQVWNYNLAFNCLFCKIYDCFGWGATSAVQWTVEFTLNQDFSKIY